MARDAHDREPIAGRSDGRAAASPALLAGLALMPLVIAAGLLRERLDAPLDVELRPTLAQCAPGGDCPAERRALSIAARSGAGSSMVRAGRS